MTRVRDSLEASAGRMISADTRRLVQDGTAIDCLIAALGAPAAERSPFAWALVRAYVEANDRGDLKGETLRPASYDQALELETLGFTRRGRRPRTVD